jgi:hypothetical protein
MREGIMRRKNSFVSFSLTGDYNKRNGPTAPETAVTVHRDAPADCHHGVPDRAAVTRTRLARHSAPPLAQLAASFVHFVHSCTILTHCFDLLAAFVHLTSAIFWFWYTVVDCI